MKRYYLKAGSSEVEVTFPEYLQALKMLGLMNAPTFSSGPFGGREIESDFHTEHCCKICGCKYGDDVAVEGEHGTYIECSVVSGRKPQAFECGEASACL